MAGCAFHGRMIRRRRPTKRVLMLLIRPSHGEIVMDQKNHEVAEANVRLRAARGCDSGATPRPPGPTNAATGRSDSGLGGAGRARATVRPPRRQLLDIGYRMGDEIKANLGPRRQSPRHTRTERER